MRKLLRTFALVAAAVAAAGALYIFFTLPDRPLRLDGALPPHVVAGVYHVHTTRSDGTRSVDDIAASAARAGLKFVIFTDHGDGTRPPDPPSYRHGVLCIDAVEINTAGGHLVALGLDGAAPYPLGGEPADVIEDIHRLGGRAILAHPDSPNRELQWRPTSLQFDGLEWLNADSEWRDEEPGRLVGAAARALVRPAETIVSLFGRPDRTLQRWDAVSAVRPVVGLAAVDAHGGIVWSDDEGQGSGLALTWPGYTAMFRVVSQHVPLDRPLSGEAAVDAAVILQAIREGRTYSVIEGYAGPASLEFDAEQGSERVTMGGWLSEADRPTTFRARVPQAPGARLVLLHNGTEIASGQGRLERTLAAAAGAYRVEAQFPGRPAPWIVANPIGIGPRELQASVPAPRPTSRELVRVPPDAQWRTEFGSGSDASIHLDRGAVIFRYRLGKDPKAGPYAAVVRPIERERERGFDRIQIDGHASHPMRVSLQVRLPVGPDGLRFQKTIYLDQTPRTIIVRLADMRPIGPSTTQQPIVAHVREVMVVVDNLNTSAGSEGTLWISHIALGVGDTGGD